MDDGRLRFAVTAGRVGLFVVAVGTAWGAVTTAGGHGLGARLVAAPAVALANPHEAAPPTPEPEVTGRLAAPAPVSRAHLRAAILLPAPAARHVPAASRRHVAR